MNPLHDVTEILNSDLADSITIDGVPARGIYSDDDGKYDEPQKSLLISSAEPISDMTLFVVRGKTYGAMSWHDDGFGAVTVLLGAVLQ